MFNIGCSKIMRYRTKNKKGFYLEKVFYDFGSDKLFTILPTTKIVTA
jgi:hypothetical protein